MFCYDGVCGGRLPELARSSLVIVVLRKLPSREPTSSRSTISGVASREAVYTVRCEDAVYVLHAFQKKSKKGYECHRRSDVAILGHQRCAKSANGLDRDVSEFDDDARQGADNLDVIAAR